MYCDICSNQKSFINWSHHPQCNWGSVIHHLQFAILIDSGYILDHVGYLVDHGGNLHKGMCIHIEAIFGHEKMLKCANIMSCPTVHGSKQPNKFSK